jgi:hypothetical protein
VIIAFSAVLGSAAVAAALAFGLGGRETAGRVLEQWRANPPAPPAAPPSVPSATSVPSAPEAAPAPRTASTASDTIPPG